MIRKTKIVCTIGPACDDRDTLVKMIQSGMNVARLNFSHGDHEEQGKRIRLLKEIRDELQAPLGIMLDTKGPEIRLGTFKNGQEQLVAGEKFTLTTRDVLGDNTIVSVSHQGLAKDLSPGASVLLDDGLIELRVLSIDGENILCQIINGGLIKTRKGVNVPGVYVSIPPVSDKDLADIQFGCAEGIDFIAASFVQSAQDVLSIRAIVQECGRGDLFIISKIENSKGVENFEEILDVSDGVMVARGDLGVEIPIEQVPVVQKKLIHLCNLAGKPVITATQMLDSMIHNPRPTRAEANDVANSIIDGTDAIMLSGETASGSFPLEALRVMDRIAKTAQEVPHWEEHPRMESITAAVCHACCAIAEDMGAKAIITPTTTGGTPRMVARHRPSCPVVGCAMTDIGFHRLSLFWGVIPLKIDPMTSTDALIARCLFTSREKGVLDDGDIAVITAGVPLQITGTTNLIHVQIVGDMLLNGRGVGSKYATGIVRICDEPETAKNFREGDILVAEQTDPSMLSLMKKASALIVEDPDPVGHAAMVGLSLDIPVITSADSARKILSSGDCVTVYAGSGYVYKGKTPGM